MGGGGGCHKIGRGRGLIEILIFLTCFSSLPPPPPPRYIGNDQVLRVLLTEMSLSFICALK